MRYGFAIDQRTCIGCHACTVACKTEHEVPVGQFRTWVKYVDKGEYPSTTREFGVLRCNHCTDAPCVSICPTTALFKRDDGIVDFDADNCIGCKSCLQACPYDAIYIDADTNTAAKCNFCAHRVDEGLEPACVVVCPTHSIWVGDVDDPSSGIGRLIRENPVTVRAAEQNTGPNVFYLGADRAVLDPLEAPVRDTYLWAKPDDQRLATAGDVAESTVTQATTTLNTAHPRPWGWRVSTYLWTKSVGAGALLVVALALFLRIDLGVLTDVVAPVLALAMTAVTGLLLVWDLKRPARFLYMFLRPQWRSWVTLGAFVLVGFGGVALLWLLAGVGGADGALALVRWLAIPAGVLAAGYTAFLFGQAEGRDLWQSPLLFWHLVVQAFMVGSGALAVIAQAVDVSDEGQRLLARVLLIAAVVHLLMLALEYGTKHATRNASVAAHVLIRGRYAGMFWGGNALAGIAAVLAVAGWGGVSGSAAVAVVVAGVLVQVALLAYETVFVRAAQEVPLS
ncbi:4Fe-4S dicluster domain-containing protein [Phytoactinopolyspora mesophila]|uniref:4Fe-4S dicluster domain-containing protein n=1 Tax=Phytoactinopolyspora mesophila TaxID=2650750 RepID=A0A7K3MCW1_9ACTN|nr:4Fe-4S dicluster domain-containing protein [Phytoactinopolyspora mesophila]NDL61094.1 4Fe-4S dicluster domain-containing protein [Phytoactinopolyspora mesophila]